jgi:GTP-binding protein EngB required for normal cell division
MVRYEEMLKNLETMAQRLENLVKNNNVENVREQQQKILSQSFNLVVLGQFKRGKSTFINALLGAPILPTAVVPLTSVVTILSYGESPKAVVRFLSGGEKVIDIGEIASYITEKENPKNEKGVKEVEVFYPSEYLKNGVRIIDTPGVGSVYNHNTEVAYNYLPHVDAGIFIVSADPPLSQSEHSFLQDIKSSADKIFFVLNKIDQVNEEERRESLEFTKTVIEDDFGKGKVKIFPLSARWALEGKLNKDEATLKKSLLPEFEARLRNFLIQEKGLVLLRSITNNLLRIVSNEMISSKLEEESLKLPLEELKRKIEQFENEVKLIEKEREANVFLLQGHTKKIIQELDEAIGEFKKSRLPKLLAELEQEYMRRTALGGGNLREELEKFVFSAIQNTFSEWRQAITESISSQLEAIHLDFARKVNSTIERITDLAGSIFSLKLEPFTSVPTLSRKSEFYFLLKDDPVGLELLQMALTSALPGFLTKKMILKKMKESVTELLDRHCGRVRYDLVNRIQDTVKGFQKELLQKIDETLEAIRLSFQKAITLHNSSREEVNKSLGLLSERIIALKECRDKLEGYLKLLDEKEPLAMAS